MKKLILTCTLIATIAISATAKTPTQIMSTDLIGSWEFKTSYILDSAACYLKTENLHFYEKNNCILQSAIVNCATEKSITENITLRWRKEGNIIILYDNKNNIVNYYVVNNENIINIYDKTINNEKVINKIEEEKLFSCIM